MRFFWIGLYIFQIVDAIGCLAILYTFHVRWLLPFLSTKLLFIQKKKSATPPFRYRHAKLLARWVKRNIKSFLTKVMSIGEKIPTQEGYHFQGTWILLKTWICFIWHQPIKWQEAQVELNHRSKLTIWLHIPIFLTQ